MFRLAHISDVHLGPLPPVRPWQLMNKRITGYLNWKLNRSSVMNDGILEGLVHHLKQSAPHHIAVSGDLVNLALPAEILRMRQWLADLGAPQDVSVTLGNHDTYVPGAGRACRSAWGAYMTGDEQEQCDFPYLRERNGVALIVANSGHASAPFMATGRFGKRQEKEVSTLLKAAGLRGQFRILMIHHPPFERATSWAKRLIGDDRFRTMVEEQGAELILHGHTHIESLEEIKGPDGPIPVIGVPSASQGLAEAVADVHGRPAARYNLFDISGKPGSWICTHREFGYSRAHEGVGLIAVRELYGQPESITGH